MCRYVEDRKELLRMAGDLEGTQVHDPIIIIIDGFWF